MTNRLTTKQKQERKLIADYYKNIGYVYDKDLKWWRPPVRATARYTKYLAQEQQDKDVSRMTKKRASRKLVNTVRDYLKRTDRKTVI